MTVGLPTVARARIADGCKAVSFACHSIDAYYVEKMHMCVYSVGDFHDHNTWKWVVA